MKEYTIYVKTGISAHDIPIIAYRVAEDGKPSVLRSGVEAGAVSLKRQELIGQEYKEIVCKPLGSYTLILQRVPVYGDKDLPIDEAVEGMLDKIREGIGPEDKVVFVMGDTPWRTYGRSLAEDRELEKAVEELIEKYKD